MIRKRKRSRIIARARIPRGRLGRAAATATIPAAVVARLWLQPAAVIVTHFRLARQDHA
jgi:hypothetical protein